MNTKLTLRLDDALIQSAKRHSSRSGKSVSRLVADYFALIDSEEAAAGTGLTPRVRSLMGVLAGATSDEQELPSPSGREVPVRVLFDTNAVLDVLLAREPQADATARLLSLVDGGKLEGILCAATVTTIHSIAEKTVGADSARQYIGELLTMFDVACVDRQVLLNALERPLDDFEDAVLHEAARDVEATAIVTHNGNHFRRATLPVFDPAELLAALQASSE